MDNMNEKVENVIQIMNKTAAMFYRQKNKEGLILLDEVLQNLIFFINEVNLYQQEHGRIILEDENLNLVLGKAMAAIEANDLILLADLFVFELKPILEQISSNLE